MIPRFSRKYSIALACISGLMSFSAYTGCQVAGAAHSSRSEEVGSQTAHSEQEISVATPREEVQVVVGAERTELLLPLLRDKRVALVANATSVVGMEREHLLDNLLRQGVNVVKILGPEHGFRGDADAGATVKDERDVRTGIPIVSLYGKNKKPTPRMLADVDVLLFDMQDVGTRFFTYISTLHYVMEACAVEQKKLIVTDRPNPNDYVDGPILQDDCRSFVGVDPLPILHGLTIGELANMINGEGWLGKKEMKCDLTVVPMSGWKHGQEYALPVKPSPNLPTANAIAWYPSLCLFEATIMSVGRGTDFPFEVLGYPKKVFGSFVFVPRPIRGMDSNPLYKGRHCYGVDLRGEKAPRGLSLQLLIRYYRTARREGIKFVNRKQMFNLLAGTKELAQQIEKGRTEEQIRASWQSDLDKYHKLRKKYLLYPTPTE